jgi:hypothetical protein
LPLEGCCLREVSLEVEGESVALEFGSFDELSEGFGVANGDSTKANPLKLRFLRMEEAIQREEKRRRGEKGGRWIEKRLMLWIGLEWNRDLTLFVDRD